MSVDNFYCFLWVKIHWDIKLKHFFSYLHIYVCVCLCLYKHTWNICVYLWPYLHGPICKDCCWRRYFFYYYRLWFLRVKIAIFLFQIKKTTIFCTVTINNVWWNTDNSRDTGTSASGFSMNQRGCDHKFCMTYEISL